MLNRLINMKRDKTEALDDLLESNKLSISDKENQSGFYTGYINVIDITIDQFKQNENLTGAELHHAIDAEIDVVEVGSSILPISILN